MSSPDRSELDRQTAGRRAGDLDQDVTSETQALFFVRLRSLLERRHGATGAKLLEEQQRVLDRAIYSTFCDCLELGLSDQARSLLREHQAS